MVVYMRAEYYVLVFFVVVCCAYVCSLAAAAAVVALSNASAVLHVPAYQELPLLCVCSRHSATPV